MKEYYELHVTMEAPREVAAQAVEAMGWKFSAIDGDPVLGRGVKCYATKQLSASKFSRERAIERVRSATATLESCEGVKVLRDKVELVIYDSKTFRLDGEA